MGVVCNQPPFVRCSGHNHPVNDWSCADGSIVGFAFIHALFGELIKPRSIYWFWRSVELALEYFAHSPSNNLAARSMKARDSTVFAYPAPKRKSSLFTPSYASPWK